MHQKVVGFGWAFVAYVPNENGAVVSVWFCFAVLYALLPKIYYYVAYSSNLNYKIDFFGYYLVHCADFVYGWYAHCNKVGVGYFGAAQVEADNISYYCGGFALRGVSGGYL